MSILRRALCIGVFFVSSFTYGQVGGTWEGVLEVAPGNELRVQFIIQEKSDGSLAVVLNSPESGAIKNVSANSASLTDNTLRVEVAALSGSYQGKLENGNIVGEWKQPGANIPLTLAPFVETTLSDETIASITGRWQGALEVPGTTLTIVMQFEKTESGKIRGFMSSPDQGPQEFPMEDMRVTASEISFSVTQIRGNFKATFSGNEMDGEWSQGRALPLKMVKGDVDPRQYALELSAAAKSLLMGPWHGSISTPVGEVAAVFRFVQEQDYVRGFFDSPDRGAFDIPIKEASLENNNITIVVANGSTFTGSANGEVLEGEYSQQGQKLPITLSKGQLPVLALDIPPESASTILGNWTGKLPTPRGEITVGFRFEKTSDGKIIGFLDSPDQGMKGARITFATLEENELTVQSTLLRMEYNGDVGTNEISGSFSQNGLAMDLVLAKTN